MNQTFTLILILIIVSCSSSPVLYPNQKFKKVGKEGAEKDIQICRDLSEKHLESSKGNQVAKSAGAGAAMSAAGGFVAGLIFSGGSVSSAVDSAGKSAVVGGAVGAAGGAISPDQLKQRFVNQCLGEKGYKVIGWD